MTRLALRLAGVVFCGATAGYALLCASAFTYHDFVRSNMFHIGAFGRWHSALYWIWLAAAVADARLAAVRVRGAWWTFAAAWMAVGAWLTLHPLLPALVDDEGSLLVALSALTPLLWLAVLDHLERGPAVLAGPASNGVETDGRLLSAALASALFSAIASAILAPILMRREFEPDLLNEGLMLGLAWTLVDQAVIFCFAALVLCVLLRVRRSIRVQYILVFCLVAGTMALVVERAVCETLGFASGWGGGVAAVAGLTIAGTWGALKLRRWSLLQAVPASAIYLFFGPQHSGRPGARQLLSLIAIVAAAYASAVVSRTADWDFLLLKIVTFALWLATFDQLFRLMPAMRIGNIAFALCGAMPLALFLAEPRVAAQLPKWTGDPQLSVRRVLDRYEIYNGSFRLADGLLRRTPHGVPAFDRYLRGNTGLGKLEVAPIDLDFVRPLGAVSPRPDIYLFVIDSLRPDYLAPYNGRVTFTPRLAQFAGESIVFRHAMTRYGATGLSLPAIWSGAVGVHRQYVKPFAPMNTLEKLLDANHYRRVMSVDVLMATLLTPRPDTIELDRGRRTLDYDLCQTLNELEARFQASVSDDPPVFAYSNPQNLHLSNLMTASVPSSESYPGFHAPYATRVRRIDACFGDFIDNLKRRGLYDRSLIVFTSDHGELLGEEGRWGHAYYLFPQILEVPLIVHLPASTPARATPSDPGALSFTTDIAPTVYAALGYAPHPANALMGEPLVGEARVDSWKRRRGDYVVAASYSPVYGVVRRNGRRLYIVDATSGDDYAYDRAGSLGWTRVPVTEGLRVTAQRIIREHLDEIRRLYRLPPAL